MIAVLHSYSRRNRGDGLLTDLTYERLGRAGVAASDCIAFALDPDSFADLPQVHPVGIPDRRVGAHLVPAAGRMLSGGLAGVSGGRLRLDRLSRAVLDADGVVGVGGGYLRAGEARSHLGTLLNHLPQLEAAAASRAPSIYLPQSIGPLGGPVGRRVGRRLAEIDVVCARDDRTVDELAPWKAAERYPDLVALHAAEQPAEGRRHPDGPPVLVARELLGHQGYEDRLRRLVDLLRPVWAVQHTGMGDKDDRLFYRSLGGESSGTLPELLDKQPAVVVSARLHAALEAVALGVPAVQLSYQRKGWGAYADCGLGDYVHDARRFDPAVVSAQVQALAEDPSPFWERFERARPGLLEASARLDELLAATLRL